uniref:Uncharacterized protein n=1 Tax=Cannabis sativa TaxID=3483 RepID=A0A803NL37_CANSA
MGKYWYHWVMVPKETVIIVDVLRQAGADVTVASVEPQLEVEACHHSWTSFRLARLSEWNIRWSSYLAESVAKLEVLMVCAENESERKNSTGIGPVDTTLDGGMAGLTTNLDSKRNCSKTETWWKEFMETVCSSPPSLA